MVRLGQCAWGAAGLMRLDCSRAVAGAAMSWLQPGCRTPGAPGLSQHLGDFAGPVGKYRIGAGTENA